MTRRFLSFLYSHFFVLLYFLVLVACESKVTEDEYIKWVTDYENELHVRRVIFDCVFDVQYQPEELLRIQRQRTASSASQIQVAGSESSNLQYFVLKISTHSGTDIVYHNVRNVVEKQEREYYFSYRFQNDITLEESGMVLPCLLYHSEGFRGGDGERTFLFAFEKPPKESTETTLVIGAEVFGSLPIKIKVAKAGIPTIES